MANNPHFYFLSDQYFFDFPDPYLMKNKPTVNGVPHSRPCFFAFTDKYNTNISWLVPVSSQYQKYVAIIQKRIAKYGFCDTVRIEKFFGKDHAFLIQNMCPVTNKYLIPYIDRKNQPVRIDNRIAASITQNAQDVLEKAKHGMKVFYPDVFKIYKELEVQILQAQKQA